MDCEEKEDLIVSIPKDFNGITLFKNLWRVSFAYCETLPKDLDSLSVFAALGLVDFSFTHINYVQLQSSLLITSLINLNLFGTKLIGGDSGEFDVERAFCIYALPKVYTLNGTYISSRERQQSTLFFETDKHGRFSIVSRKWKMEPRTFHSRKDKQEVIWSRIALLWLDAPTFIMGYDKDISNIKKIVEDMDSSQVALSVFKVFSDSSIATDLKGVALLLIFASFFQWYPKALLQDILKLLLSKHEPSWVKMETSPLNLSFADRLKLFGLLYFLLDPSSSSNTEPIVSGKFFDAIPRLLYTIIKSSYTPASSSEIFTKRNPNFNEVRSLDQFKETESLEVQQLLARVHLTIVEIFLISKNDRLFLGHAATHLQDILKHFTRELIGNKGYTDLQSKLSLGSLLKDEDWEKALPEGMTVPSKALEVKIQFVLWLKGVYASVSSSSSTSKKNTSSSSSLPASSSLPSHSPSLFC